MTKLIKRKSEFILLSLLALPFVYLAYLFFRNDSLAVYDAPGHLGLVWYLKNYLWPNFSGWNFLNLLGFDQGRFYPPLFHYLAVGVSFFFNLEIATKLVVIGSLLSLPLALYFFTASFFSDKRPRLLMSGILTLVLVLLPGYLGADIKALFQVGLLPSFFATPLVFAYLASVLKLTDQKGIFWPTIFLSLLILTHLVAAIFATTFLAAVIFMRILGKRSLQPHLFHLILSILMTSFWWLPFLWQSNQISNSVHLNSLTWPNLVCLALGLLVFLLNLSKKPLEIKVVALVVIIIASLNLLDVAAVKVFASTPVADKIYNLHLYRLQIYSLLLATLLVSYYPITWLYQSFGKVKSRLYIVAAAPILTSLIILAIRPPVLITQEKTTIFDQEKINGRFLETFSREQVYPYIYSAQTKLETEKAKAWAYGLFTDATNSGPFLSSLIRSFDPENYPKAKTSLIEETVIDKKRFKSILDLFGVENLLYVDIFKKSRTDGLDLVSLSRPKQTLAEIPKLKLVAASQDSWAQKVRGWWVETGELTKLLVKTDSEKPEIVSATESPPVEIVDHNKNWSQFSLNTETQTKQPILVKFSYSDNWQAYQNNQKLKIYQVSPNLMIVFAKGKIVFKYETLWYQLFGLGLSTLTLFGFSLFWLKVQNRS